MVDKQEPSKQAEKPMSLQSLCENKALDQILKSDFSHIDLTTLEPHVLKILFGKFREEITRLREVKDKWRMMSRFCPRVYFQTFPNRSRIDTDDAYNMRDYMRVKWSYRGPERENAEEEHTNDFGGNPATPPVRWGSYDLYSDTLESEFKLAEGDNRFMIGIMGKHLGHRISSQLLYYRLASTFGMPPALEHDEYKMCRSAELQFRDAKGTIELYDYNGGAWCAFYGTEQASREALKLLNYLVSLECMHTYDGVIAGTVA